MLCESHLQKAVEKNQNKQKRSILGRTRSTEKEEIGVCPLSKTEFLGKEW